MLPFQMDFMVVAGGGSGGFSSSTWNGAGGGGGLRTSYGSLSGGGTSPEGKVILNAANIHRNSWCWRFFITLVLCQQTEIIHLLPALH